MEEKLRPVPSDDRGIEERWKLLPAYLKCRGLVKQHIESFNHFITKKLQDIVQANAVVQFSEDRNLWLRYTNLEVMKPTLIESGAGRAITPQECRLRELTYKGKILVTFLWPTLNGIAEEKKCIGEMPIMLRSNRCHLHDQNVDVVQAAGECLYDPGGYFVVKGKEKVILIQEQLAKNRIIIEKDVQNGKVILKALVTSSTVKWQSRTTLLIKDERIYMKHNCFVKNIPVAVMFRAMGAISDQEIAQLVGGDLVEYLAPSLQEARTCCTKIKSRSGKMRDGIRVVTQKHAQAYVGDNFKTRQGGDQIWQGGMYRTPENWERGKGAIADLILAHIPVDECRGGPFGHTSYQSKAIYLGIMVRRLLIAKKDERQVDDKDYYGNKRLELAGHLLTLLFEDTFKRFNREVKKEVDHNLKQRNKTTRFDMGRILGSHKGLVTNALEMAISTGNWRIQRFRMDRAGITSNLSRLSFMSAVGMMTRISSSVEKTRKVSGPRSLQPSQWGMLCPSDTPEGESCGLVKNLALVSHVTTGNPVRPLRLVAMSLGVEELTILHALNFAETDANVVFLNGAILGVHSCPQVLMTTMRELRRKGKLPATVSIYENCDHRAVYIESDAGRLCRPLIIVENRIPRVKRKHLMELQKGWRCFDDFVMDGLIEYLDVNEENNAYIALRDSDIVADTTHLEIDPMTILGVVAGLIPYPHCNQSPRNTYQCAMGKQAMGIISLNHLNQVHTLWYCLVHPQKPMVKTKTIEMCGFEHLPAGQNATLAVMSYSGYDIEDASILNRSSLDRGYGRCIAYRTSTAAIKKYPRTMDRIVVPKDLFNNKERLSYSHRNSLCAIDIDGVAMPGACVPPGAILVNKEVPRDTGPVSFAAQPLDDFIEKPQKSKLKATNYVHRVMITGNTQEQLMIKIVLRHFRRPELGDKFSSRHGQKGVCGMIVLQEDMPFNDLGMCPDMIMNPHGFPSRMTVGKMIELVSGKAGVLNGRFGDGTAFGGDKVEDVCTDLVHAGFSYTGKDYLTSGITGEPLQAYIFMGPIYYQKLKHMVLDKMHARAQGPRTALTRQPTEGRSRDGGLRLGEMERDCLIGHGAAMLLYERLMIASDHYRAYVCQQCGLIGYKNWCQYCRRADTLCELELPYACKLLFQELMSMNIAPRISLDDL